MSTANAGLVGGKLFVIVMTSLVKYSEKDFITSSESKEDGRGVDFFNFFLVFRQAHHVGRLFKNMFPSSQYTSRSFIRTQSLLTV